MNFQYATNESLTPEELKELFLSIRWFSGHYSQKLTQAMENASMIIPGFAFA